MQHSTVKLLPVVAFAIIGTAAANAQSAIDQLRPLVETSARRLVIAEQVALAKWDSGGAVEDLPREAQIIMGALRDGESRGLEPTSVSNFFKAQIEANKLVQYSLLADWHRSGMAPSHPSIDLRTTIRPELEQYHSYCNVPRRSLNQACASCAVICGRRSEMAWSRASLVRALVDRSSCLSLAQAFSMGFRSGE